MHAVLGFKCLARDPARLKTRREHSTIVVVAMQVIAPGEELPFTLRELGVEPFVIEYHDHRAAYKGAHVVEESPLVV